MLTGRLENIINFDRYPISDINSPDYRNLIEQHQSDLEKKGAAMLPNFLTDEALESMVKEVDGVVTEAFNCRDLHNPYLEESDDSFPLEHPRRQAQVTSLDVIAYDQIGVDDALRHLYQSETLLRFIQEILGGEPIYRMADPMAALTVNVMKEGHNHGWHFDESLVTTTIMIQKPEEGGEFQYVADLRGEGWDNYEALERVLEGDESKVMTLGVAPGTMLLFAGYYQLHRVSPVKGETTRYVSTLCYKDRPGICNSPEVQKLFYGRTALA
ncbi:MAG: hypothetical protein CMG71_01970 [Candidatus Marinimicrobia bacterium]|nr:hypothetical protein [Candidatus Neomarinimicrobiota bacterium]|tara:strand:- start:3573 stop:4382 length:810 start_codon:yes stop_codon:yes gene_type:complete